MNDASIESASQDQVSAYLSNEMQLIQKLAELGLVEIYYA